MKVTEKPFLATASSLYGGIFEGMFYFLFFSEYYQP